ncbi:receptor-like protein EIX2 [Vigna unguiculata]|uniref:receptor-like protein EIX2 n=1 Tax=Vigna unguiculata TaxID=3917 RepID=UPI00101639A6|nr:receptor-like protein EIX2 [Vigna unguiculata]
MASIGIGGLAVALLLADLQVGWLAEDLWCRGGFEFQLLQIDKSSDSSAFIYLAIGTRSTVTLKNSSESGEAKCIERESQALLRFKDSLLDVFGMLSTWTDNTDCCKWKRILCNHQTGHVQLLDLHGDNDYNIQYLRGAINVTSLIHLQYIQHLDLSHNYFAGTCIQNFMGFTNLRYLRLSNSYFAGGFLQNSYLDLGGYYLSGKIPSQIGNLRNLQYLSIGSNTAPYYKPNYISSSLYGAIPFSIGNLPLLRTLQLVGNFDIKSKDARWLSTLHSLTILQLSSLYSLGFSHRWLQTISKIIPNLTELRLVDSNLLDCDIQFLFHSHSSNKSTSLTVLDLSSNMLTSSTPQLLFNFTLHLQDLYLSHNNIDFSPSQCPNSPSLKILDLSYNILTSSTFLGNFNISSKLQELHLVNCSIMDRSFLISSTSTMNSLSSLLHIDLSNNLLRSYSVFHWLSNFTTNLRTLNLDYNFLEGSIPDEFEKSMNSLEYIYLSNNKLQERFYLSLGACAGYRIPESIGLLSGLEVLSLEWNSLEGDEGLALRNNSLMGELPSSLKNCNNLIMVDVSENLLSGLIPSWIGERMQQLMILIMRGNHFSGNLPLRLCYLKRIQLFDLSRNNLCGGIPTCLNNFAALSENNINRTEMESRVHWYNNTYHEIYSIFHYSNYTLRVTWMWKGVERNFANPELSFLSIDLSCNNLTGKVPRVITYMFGLVSLNLSRNNLSGEIPSEIGNLRSLESLDLSRNQFSGRIPSSLSQIDFLEKLDLSHNSLSGRIPLGRHFDTFDGSCFEGNIDLCGEQINRRCAGDQISVKPQEAEIHGEDFVFYEALYMSLGIGFFTGFWE